MQNEFWQRTERQLRAMELDESYDLFAVGYLIPQVALAEGIWNEPEDPYEVLSSYVNHCVQNDNLSEQDTHLINKILQLLK